MINTFGGSVSWKSSSANNAYVTAWAIDSLVRPCFKADDRISKNTTILYYTTTGGAEAQAEQLDELRATATFNEALIERERRQLDELIPSKEKMRTCPNR
jgi:hypothetical protein